MDGQLDKLERSRIEQIILENKPKFCLEVGTWYGGGSTKTILTALKKNNTGFLFGIEYDKSIYKKMVENISSYFPDINNYFKPYFGRSTEAIKQILEENQLDKIDFVFLDGGNNPNEQIQEFDFLDRLIPIGGYILAHDVKARKGKYLKNYLRNLSNWEIEILDTETGLLVSKKLSMSPKIINQLKANLFLIFQRANPMELAAQIFTTNLKTQLLKILPLSLRYRITNGRRLPSKEAK